MSKSETILFYVVTESKEYSLFKTKKENVQKPAPPRQHKSAEQMENSSPNPSFSICDIQIQKRLAECFAKSFPQKIVFAKPSPHCSATCLNTWRAEPQKEKCPFHFKKITPAQIRKARNIFSFWGCRVKRGGGGTIRAYNSVSSHHARGACEVITSLCFGNRFELGTIETPKQNSTVFSKPEGGTREARPKDSRRILPMNSEFWARWRALIFRRGGGSKSEAILTNSICFDTKRIFAILNLPPPKIAYFNDHLWFHFEQS